jgi:hypothetical protein
VAQAAGAFDRSNDERDTAIGFPAAVEQSQGLGDQARGQIVIRGDRLLVEDLGVGGRMLARGHRQLREVLGRCAGLVHVAAHADGDRRHVLDDLRDGRPRLLVARPIVTLVP